MAAAKAPVAIVTGAGKGIGRAIALRLLDDGWRIGAVDLPDASLGRVFKKHARRVALIEGDVAEEATARQAVEVVTEQFGRLDGLVSNAGIMVRKELRNLTFEEWRKVIDTNLTAAYLFARAAEQALRAARGAIVTIAFHPRFDVGAEHRVLCRVQGRSGRAHPCAGDESRSRSAGQLREPGLDRGQARRGEGAATQGPRPAPDRPCRQAARHCRDRRFPARP